MADWGLYSTLRGTDNWAQRRQDKAMNMQIVQQQSADEEKKTQQSMLAEENINAYLNEMAAIDVLPEDQERIKEVERSSRQNIIEGIARNNGDLSRYVSSGGITELNEYKNSILQSGEVKTALSNKENMAKIIADKQRGNRWFAPVETDVPQFKEGEPVLDEDGNQVVKPTKLTIDQQIGLYKRGVIKQINYNGSEEKKDINAMSFKGTYKDHNNPTGPNEVTASDIMFKAMADGASEEYAKHLANTYVERWKAGKEKGMDLSWKWKSMSELEEQGLKAETIYKTAKAAAAIGATQPQPGYDDEYGRALSGKGHNPESARATEWKNPDGSVGSKDYNTHTVSNYELKEIASQLGLNFDKLNGEETRDKDNNLIDADKILNPKRLADSRIYSPRTGEMIDLGTSNYTVTNVEPKVHRINGKSYLQATIYTHEPALEQGGALTLKDASGIAQTVGEIGSGNIRSETGFDHITAGWKGLVKDLGGGDWGDDNYEVTAFIPLNDSPTARKKGTEKLQGTGKQMDSDVRGTGGGGGVTRDAFRNYYEE